LESEGISAIAMRTMPSRKAAHEPEGDEPWRSTLELARCHVLKGLREGDTLRRLVAVSGEYLVAQHSIQKRAVAEEPTIVVVDDDKDFRDSLGDLFNSVGFKVKLFGSAAELLEDGLLPDVVSCLVLDVRLPGLGGLDFQTELSKVNTSIPIIFMTGHGDIPMSVKAMKAGAVDFLTKPFRDQDMLDAVTIALERDRTRRKAERRLTDLKSRLERLSPREREVLALVTTGLKNKQIAFQLDVAEITVKAHRGHVMQKMGAQSLAELVKIAETLGIKSPES
jgi:FixJ family two-component response regulator